MSILNYGKRKARKAHRCEGRDQLIQQGYEGEIRCQGLIRRGQTYQFQTYADNGALETWKSCQSCYDLIQKNGLFDE